MIAILQPLVPHYREDFFRGLSRKLNYDVYCYENKEESSRNNYSHAAVNTLHIRSIEKKGLLLYNPFSLIRKKYSVLVLMLNAGHLTTWLLLLTGFIHRKKIILWGHGISVRRYFSEEKKLPLAKRLMIQLADGIWFYTEKEQQLWAKELPALKSVSLNNTISDVDMIIAFTPMDKMSIRKKYNISQSRLFIFCARFNAIERKNDLLLQAINQLDSSRFGFIIIGDGKLKPDFKAYNNVYDFGEVYDRNTKTELFAIADMYFQPAWIGLSVVEAMAYGKPVLTLKRSEEICHGVEYGYINNGANGLLFDNMNDFLDTVNILTDEEISSMGQNAKIFAKKYLSMEHMISSGLKLIETIS